MSIIISVLDAIGISTINSLLEELMVESYRDYDIEYMEAQEDNFGRYGC